MKNSLLALTAVAAFIATPLLAGDTVALTTTKSSQAAPVSLGLGGLGAGGAILGVAALIGVVVAVSNSGSGT